MTSTIEIGFAYLHSSSLSHRITCCSSCDDIIVTGSEVGDICIWKEQEEVWSPEIVCSIGYNLPCIELVLIRPCLPELIPTSYLWILSLHSDYKLRIWDCEDGRCIRSSENLTLEGTRKICAIRDRLVAVDIGESYIMLIDAWFMQIAGRMEIGDRIAGICVAKKRGMSMIGIITVKGRLSLYIIDSLSDKPFKPLQNLQLNPNVVKQLSIETPRNLICSNEGLIGVVYSNSITLYLISENLEDAWQETVIHFPSSLHSAFITQNFLLAVTVPGRVYQYSLDLLLQTLETSSTNPSFPSKESETELKYDQLFIRPYFIISSYKNRLYCYTYPNIFQSKHQAKMSTFSIDHPNIIPTEYFTIKKFLDTDEKVTYTSLSMTDLWPVYILSTSKGKVINCPLDSTIVPTCHQILSCSITCVLYLDYTVLIAAPNLLYLYKLYSTSMPTPTEELASLCVPGRTIYKMITVTKLHKSTEGANQDVLNERWKEWGNNAVCQSTDGTVLIVTVKDLKGGTMLFGIEKEILDASYNPLLEYLFIRSTQGNVYIVNTFLGLVERVMKIEENVVKHFEGFERFYEVYFKENYKAPISTHRVSVGGKNFPYLSLNITRMSNKLKMLKGIPKQLSFVLSALFIWENVMPSEGALFKFISDYRLNKVSVRGSLVVYGIYDTYSIHLSYSKQLWSISSYITSIFTLGYQSLLKSIKKKAATEQLSKLQASTDLFNYGRFKRPDLCYMIIHALGGHSNSLIELAKGLLTPAEIYTLTETSKILLQGEHGYTSKKDVEVKLLDAIGCAMKCILKHEGDENIENILLSMMKSKRKGYFKIACKEIMELETIQQIPSLVIITTFASQANEELRPLYIKQIMKFGAQHPADLVNFIQKTITDKRFASTLLAILETFIITHPTIAALYLPLIVDVIMKSLDPHNSHLRKQAVAYAGRLIQQIVSSLPMASFTQAKQRLALGTFDAVIIILDLKTATRWKVLEGHEGPISALAFDSSGSVLASYSADDLSLRLWKLDSGLLSSILSGNTLRPNKVIFLPEISPHRPGVLLDVGITWNERGRYVTVVREDGVRYNFPY